MLVKKSDGSCRECNGQLEIIEADYCTMTCVCLKCDEEYTVEPDAFNDGGIYYWPNMMANQESDEDEFAEDFFSGDSFE